MLLNGKISANLLKIVRGEGLKISLIFELKH